MKRRSIVPIIASFCFLQSLVASPSPSEVMLEYMLKPPRKLPIANTKRLNISWKVGHKQITEKYQAVRWIPEGEELTSSSKLHGLQVLRDTFIDEWNFSPQKLEDIIKARATDEFGTDKMKWQALSTYNKGLIYELIVYPENQKSGSFHEISRVFVHGNDILITGFTHLSREMDPDERATYIDILKNDVSLVNASDPSLYSKK